MEENPAPGSSGVAPTPAPERRKGVMTGALLLDLPAWTRVKLGPQLDVLEGGADLARLAGCEVPAALPALLRDSSAAQLAADARKLTWNGVATRYARTRAGRLLELILTRTESGFDLLARTPENVLQVMENLSFAYRAFLNSNLAVCFTDTQGIILDANRGFLDLYGYQLDEVVGENPRILKSGRQRPDMYRNLWEEITDPERGYWSGEVINRRRDGQEVIVLLTVSAVRDGSGRHVGYSASALDITQRKRMEEELEAKNQELESLNRLKSELMAITSHDLRSPLHALTLRAQQLRTAIPKSSPGYAEAEAGLSRIAESAHRLSELVQNLLDLEKASSRSVKLSLRRVFLDAVLRTCVETLSPSAEERGAVLRLEVTARRERVVVDAIKIEQVFSNIISNALRFTPRGSEVLISLVDGADGGKAVSIADRGPGIPPEDLTRIFDRYYQVRKRQGLSERAFGGAGLGLAIAKGIVESHQGSIHAENRAGGGAVFTVNLPRRASIGTGRDLAVIIVDPAGILTPELTPALEKRGVEIFTVRNAWELRRIHEYEQPELVFFDAGSIGGDAASFLKEIELASGAAPLLVAVEEQEGEAVQTLGASILLTLPIMETEIFEIIFSAAGARGEP